MKVHMDVACIGARSRTPFDGRHPLEALHERVGRCRCFSLVRLHRTSLGYPSATHLAQLHLGYPSATPRLHLGYTSATHRLISQAYVALPPRTGPPAVTGADAPAAEWAAAPPAYRGQREGDAGAASTRAEELQLRTLSAACLFLTMVQTCATRSHPCCSSSSRAPTTEQGRSSQSLLNRRIEEAGQRARETKRCCGNVT